MELTVNVWREVGHRLGAPLVLVISDVLENSSFDHYGAVVLSGSDLVFQLY